MNTRAVQRGPVANDRASPRRPVRQLRRNAKRPSFCHVTGLCAYGRYRELMAWRQIRGSYMLALAERRSMVGQRHLAPPMFGAVIPADHPERGWIEGCIGMTAGSVRQGDNDGAFANHVGAMRELHERWLGGK